MYKCILGKQDGEINNRKNWLCFSLTNVKDFFSLSAVFFSTFPGKLIPV